MRIDLRGKVVAITGASRGLGLALAKGFGRAGASVAICSRSAEAVDRAIAELATEGIRATGRAGDVAEAADLEAFAAHVEASLGPIDVWVNNAGLSAPWGPTAHVPSARFRALVGTNIVGVYNGSLTAIRRFLARRTGVVVNILGRGDSGSVPFQNAYSSSKVWVRNFTKALAAEYRKTGIKVYGFNPGLVRTDMLSQVEAVRGWERDMEPLRVVTAVLGNEAEVPAARLVRLVASAGTLPSGRMVSVLTPGFMLSRAARTLGRLVSGRGLGLGKLEVEVVEPEIPV